eukprot:364229-Chlamydomonas_euryale.AAC.3
MQQLRSLPHVAAAALTQRLGPHNGRRAAYRGVRCRQRVGDAVAAAGDGGAVHRTRAGASCGGGAWGGIPKRGARTRITQPC